MKINLRDFQVYNSFFQRIDIISCSFYKENQMLVKRDSRHLQDILKEKSSALEESQKKYNCLVNILNCLNLKDISLENMLKKICGYIIPTWQYPARTYVKIVYKNTKISVGKYRPTRLLLKQEFIVQQKTVGYIEIGCLESKPYRKEDVFSKEEKRLLNAICKAIEMALEKRHTRSVIQKIARKVQEKNRQLDQKELAIKEILSQVDTGKREYVEQLAGQIRNFIFPIMNKLKKKNISTEALNQYLQILKQNLHDLTSGATNQIAASRLRLSPREAEICSLIKNGLQTKEIARILQISILTVERHRFNIRKKLGLSKQQVNLQIYLQNS